MRVGGREVEWGVCGRRLHGVQPTHAEKAGTKLIKALEPHCYNGVRDNDETDVDCGGQSCPARCAFGDGCRATDAADGARRFGARRNIARAVARAPPTPSGRAGEYLHATT